jgi:uncharacterized protein (UPF0147 family)
MEAIEPKIIAAISAAVKAYIEETTLAQIVEEPAAPPFARVNLWAIAGRQDLLMQRRLWQLRVY